MDVEVLREVSDEVVEAFGRLIPQLSASTAPPGREALETLVRSPATTVLIARADGEIAGTLTLVLFQIPTGTRAWIEDVVVDKAVGRRGVGTALVTAALRLAQSHGARTVDLTSRPSREAAGRLYVKTGFTERTTRVYRHTLDAVS
jgi:ribosomal protein S18 acetylase RimI-like enzyme